MKGYDMKVPSAGGAFAKRSNVPPVSMPRSVFDLSKGHKTSMDSGLVVPLWVEEVLPGDTFRVQATVLLRLATLLFPLMDNLYVDLHFFFCPWRLVWTNTAKFFGEQDNPADSTTYTIPQFDPILGSNILGLQDYFGINPISLTNQQFNSLQWRAYRLIWNKWYRDENLQNSVSVPTGDGPDSLLALNDVLPRNKRGDYFTLALPWAQKGTPVMLPLSTSQPVVGAGSNAGPLFRNATSTAIQKQLQFAASAASGGVNFGAGTGSPTASTQMVWDDPGLRVDLTSGGLATINAFRQANAMQVYLERNARGGTRYVEYLKAQWGVTSSDARLQRPEYLGGATAPLVVTPVAQLSASAANLPQGKLAGVGTAMHHGAGFVRSFEEHGYVFAMISVRADLNYQSGCPRQFKRRTVWDVANPAFAMIGEEPVYNYELWYKGDGTDNPSGIFGYQERFASYKQSYSMLTGNMRSASATSYDVWHVAQEFTAQPTLGDTFIRENPAVDRVVAVPFTDQWIVDSVINVRAARCLPVYGVPGLGAHL